MITDLNGTAFNFRLGIIINIIDTFQLCMRVWAGASMQLINTVIWLSLEELVPLQQRGKMLAIAHKWLSSHVEIHHVMTTNKNTVLLLTKQ